MRPLFDGLLPIYDITIGDIKQQMIHLRDEHNITPIARWKCITSALATATIRPSWYMDNKRDSRDYQVLHTLLEQVWEIWLNTGMKEDEE